MPPNRTHPSLRLIARRTPTPQLLVLLNRFFAPLPRLSMVAQTHSRALIPRKGGADRERFFSTPESSVSAPSDASATDSSRRAACSSPTSTRGTRA